MIACKDLIDHLSEIQRFSQELGQATLIAVDAEESKDSSIISKTEKLLNVIKLRAVVKNRIQRFDVMLMLKYMVGESTVFKKVEVGNGPKTAEDFLQVFKEKKISVSASAARIMKRPGFKISAEKKDIDLVILTGTELGLKGMVGMDKIYNAGKKMGLKYCPPEVGPQSVLGDIGAALFFVMEPIENGTVEIYDDSVYREVFFNAGNFGLNSLIVTKDNGWIKFSANRKFAFALPEKIVL